MQDVPGSEGGARKIVAGQAQSCSEGDRCSQGCDTPAGKMVSDNSR